MHTWPSGTRISQRSQFLRFRARGREIFWPVLMEWHEKTLSAPQPTFFHSSCLKMMPFCPLSQKLPLKKGKIVLNCFDINW
jgi:hypothetical protein